MRRNFWLIIGRVIQFAIPSSVGSMLSIMQQTINLAFIGSLNDPKLLAAVGMGNMLFNLLAICPMLGMNSGLETLVAQAIGAKNMRLCGVQLQRGRFLVLCSFVPFSLLFCLALYGLRHTGQNMEVIESAQEYIIWMMPALIVQALNDLQRKFLIQMDLGSIQLNSQIVSTMIHLLSNHIFITMFGFGIYGTGIATFITNLYSLSYNMYYSSIQADLQEINSVKFMSKATYNMKHIRVYLSLGIPNITILFLDWICFQGTTFMAGFLGVVPQAANIIILNVGLLFFQIPYGIQSAACALIGQQIGAQKIREAKKYYKIIVISSLLPLIVMLICMHAFQVNAIRLFTGSPLVIQQCQQVWPMILLFVAQDYIQGVLCGVIKALGQQRRAIYVNFVTYEILAIPVCYVMTFKVGYHFETISDEGGAKFEEKRIGMGLKGMWTGYAVCMFHQVSMYIYLIHKTDWTQASNEALKRIKLV